MTRIPYRRPEDMNERARELTEERGNLNVYRVLANAEKVFNGWMVAGAAGARRIGRAAQAPGAGAGAGVCARTTVAGPAGPGGGVASRRLTAKSVPGSTTVTSSA